MSTFGFCVGGPLYTELNFITWEEVQFFGQKVFEGRVNDCWQSWPPLRNRKGSLEPSIISAGHLPEMSDDQNISFTHEHCCLMFMLSFLLLLQKSKDWFSHPSLKKCSSSLITVMVSNLVNLQASLVGSTGRVVVVVVASVVSDSSGSG